MWPIESLYAAGCEVSAEKMSPGVATPRTRNKITSAASAASPAITDNARVPRRTQSPPAAIAEPNKRANAG